MTISTNYLTGSYEWNMKVSMPKDQGTTGKEWDAYKKNETRKWIESFGLKVGEKVKVLVGGGEKMMWYSGEVEAVGFDKMNGSYIRLKQKKNEKYIDGWRVSEVRKEQEGNNNEEIICNE